VAYYVLQVEADRRGRLNTRKNEYGAIVSRDEGPKKKPTLADGGRDGGVKDGGHRSRASNIKPHISGTGKVKRRW